MSSDDPAATAPNAGPTGRVDVSPQAIASVARTALIECYGVGLAPARRGAAVLSRLGRSDPFAGIEVRLDDGQVSLTLHIVVEYGVRISEVARNVIENVAFAVQKSLGMPVREVNVHVDGLHIADNT